MREVKLHDEHFSLLPIFGTHRQKNSLKYPTSTCSDFHKFKALCMEYRQVPIHTL